MPASEGRAYTKHLISMEENTIQNNPQPRALPVFSGLAQFPLYNKTLAFCVLVRNKTKKFAKDVKYDLGVSVNSYTTELFVCVMEGLGRPISKADEKLGYFSRAYDILKYINGLLAIANCMNCITDREKGVIDESLRDIAGQLRKTSNGLTKRLGKDIGTATE